MFTRGSRYEPVAESEYLDADGRIIRHKRIRFLPAPGGTAGYVVQEGDRPDLAAWRVAQDPEGYWRLCDANGIARPAELTKRAGRRILVPNPTGER